MTPLARVPVILTATAEPRPIRIRWHSYGPGLDPIHWPLIVVDGVGLGLRSDGTIDHVAAKRLLQQLRCDQIVSMHSVPSEEAVKWFGRAAHRGALLMTMAPSGSRADPGKP